MRRCPYCWRAHERDDSWAPYCSPEHRDAAARHAPPTFRERQRYVEAEARRIKKRRGAVSP